VNISADTLKAEAATALRTWPFIPAVEQAHSLPANLLLAVGSRETNLRDVVGDGGHGHGVWQRDDRFWPIPASYTVEQQANDAASLLAANIHTFGLAGGVAAYNCGGGNVQRALDEGRSVDHYTTGGDYSADVLGRLTALTPKEAHVPTVTGRQLERLHPRVLEQLHELANAAQHDIWCQSTGRSDEEQQTLYQGYLNRLNWRGGGHYNDAANPYRGFNPANPPGGPSWHRYIPGRLHAQAADISTVGLGGASARSVFGPYAAKVGLSFAIASESWHIQPTSKHPEVPFTSGPVEEDTLKVPTVRYGFDVGHPATVAMIDAAIDVINPAEKIRTKNGDRKQLVIKYFQTVNHLAADGLVGPATFTKLIEEAANSK
jgi:hypothetical protein